jgi:threonine dehydrogenase-like Zn-dependent dehydrogenase
MPYRSIKQVGFLLIIISALMSGSALATTAARASVKPESGTLALLGTGLIGLATLVRRHFSN